MSEPLLSLPEDRRVVRPSELAREVLSARGVHHVVGAEGVGPVLVARALALSGSHVVYVTTDSDMARRAAADLAFVARPGPLGPGVPGNGTPLSLTVSESSAYADVRTDRRTQMQRAGVLHHIAAELDWRFLVVPAPALLRLTTPRAPLVENALELVAESEIDVSRVSTQLAHAGYLRAPVVEDPGSFAVRGGILDVWPGNAEAPVRAELYGDLIVSLKLFDPEDQRTKESVERVLLPPAREIITSPKNQARARERMRDLCDSVNHPSTKARALEEDVVTARSAFGLDGFLPAFYELVPLWSLLPEDTTFVIEDPPAMIQALRAELERAVAGEAEHENLPHFPLNSLYVDETTLARRSLPTRPWQLTEVRWLPAPPAIWRPSS